MTTIQERRHQELIAQLNRALIHRDDTIAKLVKWQDKVTKLQRHVTRYQKYALAQKPPTPKPAIAPAPPKVEAAKVADVTDIPVSEFPIADSLDIPTFLQRKKAGEARDAIAKATILAEQAERKKLKSHNRIEEMKAKKRGDTKRMPLTGKAALQAIRQG